MLRVQTQGVVAIDGTLDIGLERVSQSCGSCNGISVSCPAGKKLLGGGCYLGTQQQFRACFPTNDTTFSSDTGGTVVAHTVYAICARVQ